MSKDITKDILLKAGFMNASDNAFKLHIKGGYIKLLHSQPPFGRCWTCYVDTTINMCKADIQTVEHFNKLMEIMNINFRLEEE